MLHESIVLSSPYASSLAFSPHNLVSLLLQFYLTCAGIKTPCSWMRLQSFCNVIFVPSSCKLNHGSYKARLIAGQRLGWGWSFHKAELAGPEDEAEGGAEHGEFPAYYGGAIGQTP
ncbi:hypothetical protein D5086_005559 [Populus alba]|uniref:Uncharacterized protein n=1 Tax=Populus alba TaxID=43335 RepID=A0ACC4CUT7_POPAL